MRRPGNRRLFVALLLPPAATGHLATAVDRLPERLREDSGLRWTPSQQWHVTLAFLGDVSADRVPGLLRHLQAAADDAGPMPTVQLWESGTFGHGTAWVGLREQNASELDGDAHARLRQLDRAVRRSCRAARCPPDDRQRWHPHVTLARTRRGRAGAGAAACLAAAMAAYRGPSWTPDRVTLVESFLGPAPRHETVQSWPLRH